MIILRQNNFSILNRLGVVGNSIENMLSAVELQRRGKSIFKEI